MIQFPETALIEWQTVADAAKAGEELRKRIKRGTEVETATEKLRVRHEASLAFQQELDADTTPALEIVTLNDYKNNPTAAPQDLIDGVLKDNGLLIVLGPSGAGKSTNALTMLHSLMTGDDWLAQTTMKIDGAMGIVSYDMDASLMLDWMSGWPNVDPDKISVVNAHKRGNPLGVPAMRAQIATLWQALNVEVIVIDSFSASFFGHDQNDAASTMAHYRSLQAFSRECGARALIVIAHSQENDPTKIRGSRVHHDVADSILSVAGTGSEPRTLRMVKYRAGIGQQMMNPAIITPPDDVTHLIGLDYGAMSIEGMKMPANSVAMGFPDLPDSTEDPDISTDEREEEIL